MCDRYVAGGFGTGFDWDVYVISFGLDELIQIGLSYGYFKGCNEGIIEFLVTGIDEGIDRGLLDGYSEACDDGNLEDFVTGFQDGINGYVWLGTRLFHGKELA